MPNTSMMSTYAVPSESLLLHGGAVSNEALRTRRVQEQVAQRLAEKPNVQRRTTTSTSNYASSDYGGSSTMKYNTYNPNFSSKSYMVSNSRPVMAHRMPQQSSSGYSSRSAVDFSARAQMSQGASTGMMYQQDNMSGFGGMSTMGGGYQSSQTQYHRTLPQISRPISRGVPDAETFSLHSQRMHPMQQQVWLTRNGSQGSLGSDQDNSFARQEAAYAIGNGYQNEYPKQAMYSTTRNNYQLGASQMSMTLPAMRPSSGHILTHNGNGMNLDEETFMRQSYKGPSQRTISKINQVRQNRSSSYGTLMQGGAVGRSFGTIGAGSESNFNMVKGRMSRAPSMKSVASVGHGGDLNENVFDLSRFDQMDIPIAIQLLRSSDLTQLLNAAAFLQHECYATQMSRNELHTNNGIAPLVNLFRSDNSEVRHHATAAVRNAIYQNINNKKSFIDADGLDRLLELIVDQDEDVVKNATGILWNLSAKETLKKTIATQTLTVLIRDTLIRLFGEKIGELPMHNEAEKETFVNTTGCLRNLSSLDKPTREAMREAPDLVQCMVDYLHLSLEEDTSETLNDKAVENMVCVLRNLSFQLYTEMSQSHRKRLAGKFSSPAPYKEPIGCFTLLHNKKVKPNPNLTIFDEVSKDPHGVEWLWHPKCVKMYQRIINGCSKDATREAAAGALQNLTAGSERWPAVLSNCARKDGILKTVLDRLDTRCDTEMCTLVGFLKNLCQHEADKANIAADVVRSLVDILPCNGLQLRPSSETVVNICSVLNYMVTNTEIAAQKICDYGGLEKLIKIKNDQPDVSSRTDAQKKAAGTLLVNMFQYTKLHKAYKKKGFTKENIKELLQ